MYVCVSIYIYILFIQFKYAYMELNHGIEPPGYGNSNGK